MSVCRQGWAATMAQLSASAIPWVKGRCCGVGARQRDTLLSACGGAHPPNTCCQAMRRGRMNTDGFCVQVTGPQPQVRHLRTCGLA